MWVPSRLLEVTGVAGRGVTLHVGQSCSAVSPSLKYAWAIASQSGHTASRPQWYASTLVPWPLRCGPTETVSHLGHIIPETSACRPWSSWLDEAHPPTHAAAAATAIAPQRVIPFRMIFILSRGRSAPCGAQ